MRVYTIPTITAGATALLSIFFFVGLSRAFGDIALGQVVLIQSAAAVALIASMPQSGPYMIAARDEADLTLRYRRAVTLELLGVSVGALVLSIAALIPIRLFDVFRNGALIIYWSLAIQGMSSCSGWLRARENWTRYALWNLIPNLVRVPMIWLAPIVAGPVWVTATSNSPVRIITLFFLLPDLVRFALMVAPVLVQEYRLPPRAEVMKASKTIGQNWIYDIGSQLTDVADKLVVGGILGPQTLAAYFFARRIGATTSMVTEPFYWERFRRIARSDRSENSREERRVYLHGLLLSAALFGALGGAILGLLTIGPLAQLTPAVISDRFPLFIGVLWFECILAANRWSRFLSQIKDMGFELFLVRSALFALFSLNVVLFGGAWDGFGTVVALGITATMEGLYVYFRMLTAREKFSLDPSRLEMSGGSPVAPPQD